MEKVRCRVGLVFSDASSLPGESGGGDIVEAMKVSLQPAILEAVCLSCCLSWLVRLSYQDRFDEVVRLYNSCTENMSHLLNWAHIS